MLLLVLILVLVAFGLLVVALLTGNVLSAWLSVAVSVAAAVVLVIDWLQRRSAVKAGRAGAESTPSSATADVARGPRPGHRGAPGLHAGKRRAGRRRRSGSTASADGQQTVVMPAVQPSGSAARPSGAEGPSTPSGGFFVTQSDGSRARAKEADLGRVSPAGRSDDRSDAEATVVVDIRKAGIGDSSAGADAPGGAAGSEEESGSKPGGVGPAVAGAVGLAGAAAVGGAAKDAAQERTAADTQAVDVRKTDQPGDARPPAGAGAAAASGLSKERASEERPAGAGAPRSDDRVPAGSSSAEGRSGSTPGSQARTDSAPGLRPDAERGAAASAADSGPGSRPDDDRGATAFATDSAPGSLPTLSAALRRRPPTVRRGRIPTRARALRRRPPTAGRVRVPTPAVTWPRSRPRVALTPVAAALHRPPSVARGRADAERGGAPADSGRGSRPDADHDLFAARSGSDAVLAGRRQATAAWGLVLSPGAARTRVPQTVVRAPAPTSGAAPPQLCRQRSELSSRRVRGRQRIHARF